MFPAMFPARLVAGSGCQSRGSTEVVGYCAASSMRVH